MTDTPPPTQPTPPSASAPDPASPSATAAAVPDPAPETSAAPCPPGPNVWQRIKIAAAVGALVGMVVGAVVEMFVQGWLESTGWFGPTLDNVIQAQMTNFTAIQDKLAALERASTEAERQQISKDLAALLREQKELTERTHVELMNATEQIARLREEALQRSGVAGGVDFWLQPGQSVSVGSRDNVFALNYIYPRFVQATLSGKSLQLKPGDFAEAPVGDKVYKVFYRTSPKGGGDNRAGFDIVAPE